jgi:diaminohydroxyphosphoribosylaminopyrimidine deaminase/5-amino-6-(5-phosphoribosylamino)uracil reductase
MDIEVLTIETNRQGRVDLAKLFEKLGSLGISSVLVEGGAAITTSLIRQNLADKYIAIIAPKLLGKGTETVGDLQILDITSSMKLNFIKTYRSGEDIVIEAKPDINRL